MHFFIRDRLILGWIILFLLPLPHLQGQEGSALTAPNLTNNPSWDVVATSRRPLLSVFNASGGVKPRTYEYQLSMNPAFPDDASYSFQNIKETDEYITEMQVPNEDSLKDGKWYWRARAIDAKGTVGPWATTRFYVDATHSKTFMNLQRVKVKTVTASSGKDAKDIIDWSDEGQATYWLSLPLGRDGEHWVQFDFGEPKAIARFWMLSNIKGNLGWLTDFVWQQSQDGRNWTDIPGTRHKDNDTHRNIIDINPPVKARYFRLLITGHIGLHAQLHAVIPYTKGMPEPPTVPKQPYVLIIGNQLDGFTYTELAEFIESGNPFGLKTVVVPHHKVSLQMVEQLNPQPVAIVCSGSNAQYQNMPMFEFYGEFELIRKTKLPLLGICAGHQYTCMAHGITYVRSMGWFNESAYLLSQGKEVPPIHIKAKYRNTPIFQGIPKTYNATEVHSWAVSAESLPKEYSVTSTSKYIETLQSEQRLLFGAQFHGEVVEEFNQGGPYITNFLRIALDAKKQQQQKQMK